MDKSLWRKCCLVSLKAQDRTAKHRFRLGFTRPLLHSLLSKTGTIVQYKQHFFFLILIWCLYKSGLFFGLIIFVACSHLFLFLWCSILSIWNEIQMCSWSIADGITGWSWIGKRNNLTMRKISIWKVCFQSVCLNLGILSFYWAFGKVYFEIMRLYKVWEELEIPKSTIYC